MVFRSTVPVRSAGSDVLTSEMGSLALDPDISYIFINFFPIFCLTGLAFLMQYVLNPIFVAWTKVDPTNCPRTGQNGQYRVQIRCTDVRTSEVAANMNGARKAHRIHCRPRDCLQVSAATRFRAGDRSCSRVFHSNPLRGIWACLGRILYRENRLGLRFELNGRTSWRFWMEPTSK